MSNYKYPTIDSTSKTTRALGSSDSASLSSLFPQTPGIEYGQDIEAFKKAALAKLLKGEESGNLQAGTVDRDFGANASDAKRIPPDLRKVEVGGGGLPASPYVPNPTSPGEGSSDPKKQPAAPKDYGTVPTNGLASDGKSSPANSSSRNPFESSRKMSLGAEDSPYVPGESPATANASS